MLSSMLGGVRLLAVFKVMNLVETTYHKTRRERKGPKTEPSGPPASGGWRELVKGWQGKKRWSPRTEMKEAFKESAHLCEMPLRPSIKTWLGSSLMV